MLRPVGQPLSRRPLPGVEPALRGVGALAGHPVRTVLLCAGLAAATPRATGTQTPCAWVAALEPPAKLLP
ncbi:hypothetical protein ACFRIB_41085 [Streptomyces mirabilis]|uniref:hypothetical protein n=1 Tax=Streptomyces mirabilis TaxID=68239 RepID=UPI003689F243